MGVDRLIDDYWGSNLTSADDAFSKVYSYMGKREKKGSMTESEKPRVESQEGRERARGELEQRRVRGVTLKG